MKNYLKNGLQTISRWIPSRIYPYLVQRDLVGIFYHAVSDDVMAHVRHLYPVVAVSVFKESLEFLKEGFYFVSYDTLQAHYKNKIPLPPNALHLSFDDGFSECYTVVRPILLELEIPCTFFLTIDWLDNRMLYYRHQVSLCVHYAKGLSAHGFEKFLKSLNRQFEVSLADMDKFIQWISGFQDPNNLIVVEVSRLLELNIPAYIQEYQPYLTTAQVRKLHAEGFTIGAHGLTHQKLGFVPQKDLETEITGSCQAIQEITGQAIVPFSFPHSAGNVDRAFLGNILERNEYIGLLFDTKDMRTDAKFIVNRVWAERPLTSNRILHTIPEIFEHAYRDAWLDSVMKTITRLR